MRERDSNFAWQTIEAVERHGGLTDQAKIEAVERSYGPSGGVAWTPERALAKAEGKLKIPEIKNAIAEYVEEVTREERRPGFSRTEALGLMVKHIRGEITEEKLTKDGDVVEVKKAPNYAALKDYLGMTMPEPVRQLQVQTQSVSLNKTIVQHDGPTPPMNPRSLGDNDGTTQ
jgi:hypothetical protein